MPSTADIILWVGCGLVIVGVVLKAWPFLRRAVHTFDLIESLPNRLTEQDEKLDEVRRMVTENHHGNVGDPTLPDRIDDVFRLVQDGEQRTATRWDEHLAYSATIVERVAALEARFDALMPQGRPND